MTIFLITTVAAKMFITSVICNKLKTSLDSVAEKEIERQRREGWFE